MFSNIKLGALVIHSAKKLKSIKPENKINANSPLFVAVADHCDLKIEVNTNVYTPSIKSGVTSDQNIPRSVPR